ncbi:MAG: alanine racemase [Clostridia bacterium]|nr:alanine racemase [Clostridia bacterium]
MDERVAATIFLDRLEHNYKHIKSLVGETCRVMAVVKADAYGHGAKQVGRTLYSLGCRDFAVACLPEADDLAEAGIDCRILILGPTDAAHAAEIAAKGYIQACDGFGYAQALAAQGKIKVHIKVDTGMSRIGIYCHSESDVMRAAGEIERISKLENIEIDGIFTHFADSDGSGRAFTDRQFAVFTSLLAELEKRGVRTGTRHCCNSAATVKFPEMHLDMVRAGIILYGLMPSEYVKDEEILPCMKLSARICAVHELKKGDCVSYGCAYTAERDTRVAVISIGYADGFSRIYSGKPVIKINGKKFATAGRICMDMCMVDIGAHECKVGDEAVIFETPEDIETLANALGTINYEVLCSLKHRVKLIYNNTRKG